jgi:hypothetical protein
MNQKTTILPILAALSVATLIGGFAIQAAEAAVQVPQPRLPVTIGPLTVSESEVLFDLREVAISIGERGISIVPTQR